MVNPRNKKKCWFLIYPLIISFIGLISCQTKNSISNNKKIISTDSAEYALQPNKDNSPEIILEAHQDNQEHFIDSLNIGNKGHNKIEVKLIHEVDCTYVVIDFYTKELTEWKSKNHYEILKDPITPLDPRLIDYTNDNYLDFNFKSHIPARGSNDARKLFYYDKNIDQLIYIKNSAQYPNIRYNSLLDCLDAFLIYGGSSTVFLELEADSLRATAWVNLHDQVNIYKIDRDGHKVNLRYDSINKIGRYVRFKNYDPLVVNEEETW